MQAVIQHAAVLYYVIVYKHVLLTGIEAGVQGIRRTQALAP